MVDYEKLGAFYLGRNYDLERGAIEPQPLLYDARDLVTHGVCVGMTGSGKTGLCIGLLEEAAIDGIPALVIDPKGDLANLMLTFPELRPADFRPWVQEASAARKGLSVEAFATQQAELWRQGLAEWDQDGRRIRRLRDAADFAVYTPGSQAGLPVSILKSFAAPPPAVLEDADVLRERVSTTATSLLALLGIDADPIQSREHILLSHLFTHAWTHGTDVDLGGLIRLLQDPPITRVGVLDLESFYPQKERFALSMRINNLLAAPGFQSWLEGEPLDVQRLLYTPEGKARVAIFSIAHLGDAERMFFVSLLLNEALAWMRTQSGTSSLRALLYMDEIFGYLPPTANPPSKRPLLTLMKQARAFGFGVLLSTQNPVDLDYKALSNAGTWFVGRLQTERDKARLLDGLESLQGGGGPDRATLERMISNLGKRVFLLHNVHESGPQVFHTRWVMSYLRGPMTREEIRRLMAPRKAAVAGAAGPAGAGTTGGTAATATSGSGSVGVPAGQRPPATPDSPPAVSLSSTRAEASASPGTTPGTRPLLPADIPQCAVPATAPPPEASATLVYRPHVVGAARIDYVNARAEVDTRSEVTLAAEPDDDLDWGDAVELPLTGDDLLDEPDAGAQFEDPPPAATRARAYRIWERALRDWLYRNRPLEIWRCRTYKLYGKPGESEGDFRVRVREAARAERDRRVDKLRARYAKRFERLQDKIRRCEQIVQRESEQLGSQKTQTAISFGAALLGSLLGRKRLGTGTIGRATTAMRGVGRSRKEAQDVARARDNLEAARARLAELEERFEEEIDELTAKYDPDAAAIESLTIRPRKTNIAVERLALGWVPYWRTRDGRTQRA